LVPTLRSVNYVFAQDEWRFANDWALTLGLRTDNYSDFGSTTNPRLALVWDARQDLVVKLLHGRAFRAPSLVEEYPGVNPTQVGNPNIKPETITTDELVFAWQPQLNLQTNLTLFQTRERNIIQYVRTAANLANAKVENLGGQTGRGLELEVQWNVHRDLRLSSSYSLQHTTVDASGKDAGLAPRRRIYFRSDWRFASQWQWGAAINHVADRAREPGDTRPPIADYTTVDMSLHKRNLWGGNWALQLGVKNLFNADAREPSYAPGNIPNDLPLAGRSASLQLQRNF
jgi:iron complex outermembrane receptor protein